MKPRGWSSPRVREEGLLVERLDTETVVYDTTTREAHCLAPLAAVVFAHADGRTPLESLASHAEETLGEPVSTEQVESALTQLSEARLLDEPEETRLSSRRQMIRRSATFGAAAVGASLVTSIVTPVAASAASCNVGAPCSSKTDCGPNPTNGSCHCAGTSTFCAGANKVPSCCGVCAINSPMGCRCTQSAGCANSCSGCTITADACTSVIC
jgi:hypothetical protein